MKVALLSPASCIHTARWANGLVSRGVDVHLISIHPVVHDIDSRVHIYFLPIMAPWGYVLSAAFLKRLLRDLRPDILNAHYATGYGLLARLGGFKPLLLSVWGSDVYEFPGKSILHRALLKANLKAATAIASTSICMAEKTAETFEHGKIYITPFGIDHERFQLFKVDRQQEGIVIGTVKTLEEKYGIDTLIQAFAMAVEKVDGSIPIFLEISGGGRDYEKLQGLAEHLGISNKVTFHGAVAHELVPHMLNRLDVYVALSRFESFGVAILEASACEKPVIVSDAEGPAEVTLDGITGYVVAKQDPSAACDAMVSLALDAKLRERFGRAGRKHVLKNYSWARSIDNMLEVYENLTNEHAST
jgi:glycosyltransferase involved in cell wall biosynthesis